MLPEFKGVFLIESNQTIPLTTMIIMLLIVILFTRQAQRNAAESETEIAEWTTICEQVTETIDATAGLGRDALQTMPQTDSPAASDSIRGFLVLDETDKHGSHAPQPVEQEVGTDPEIHTTESETRESEPIADSDFAEDIYVPNKNEDAVMLAKTVAIEAPSCSTMEQAAVMWCVLNRCDDPSFPSTVSGNVTITSPRQFGYYPTTPLRSDLYELALDVLDRWEREKSGETDVGRVLPREYLYFWGDTVAHNYFRIHETDHVYWDWSAPNPYEEAID